MSAHYSPLSSINSMTRLSIYLSLLVVFAPYAVLPQSQVSPQDKAISPPLHRDSINLTGSDWDSIFAAVQRAEGRTETDFAHSLSQSFNHPFSIDQWLQQAHLTPNDPTPMMSFGYSVAMDGDTVVVGAYWNHNPVIGGGATYVFVKPAAGWPAITQVAKLIASDSAFHDRFGWSVAISGNTIVVGAYSESNNSKTWNGSAYVFVKPDGGWTNMTETAKLTASDPHDADEFGRRVAISGDTIVVGVPNDDVDLKVNQGSAYVFTKPVTGWTNSTETAKLTASDGVAGDLFGTSVAISGNTIVVGAHGHNHGAGVAEGQAYIFNQSGGWVTGTENARLTASVSYPQDNFGWSASIDGDVVVIGAPGGAYWAYPGKASAYVFIKPAGGWIGDLTEHAILTASDGIYSDEFADCVDISGDSIVVGAPVDDIGSQTDQGSAYVFSKPVSGWASMTETDKLVASDGTGGDKFGTSVGISGDTLIVGAPVDDITSSNDDIGSAYIFNPQSVPPPKYIFLPIEMR